MEKYSRGLLQKFDNFESVPRLSAAADDAKPTYEYATVDGNAAANLT